MQQPFIFFTMKNSLFFLLVMAFTQTYAQELLFSSGINTTRYEYKNAQGQVNENIEDSSGAFYEIGYIQPLGIKDRLTYNLGLTLNEYNALGGDLNTLNTWQTKYLGLKTGVAYALISTRGGFKANFNFALQASSIVDGVQFMNGRSFDLTKEDDFKGIFLQPIGGIDFSYLVADKLSLGLGYQYSQSSKITNKTAESLNFLNHQLQFKLLLHLKKNKNQDLPEEIKADLVIEQTPNQ